MLFFKLWIESAIARDIARGIPSGIATMRMQIERMQTLMIFKRVGLDHKPGLLSSVGSAVSKVTMTKLRVATVAIAMVAIMQYLLIYKHDSSSFCS